MGLDLHKSPGAEHLGGRQSHTAMFPNDLPEGIIGEPGHGSLEQRRIDDQRADFQRTNHRGKIQNRKLEIRNKFKCQNPNDQNCGVSQFLGILDLLWISTLVFRIYAVIRPSMLSRVSPEECWRGGPEFDSGR